jgi:hypothetical protein
VVADSASSFYDTKINNKFLQLKLILLPSSFYDTKINKIYIIKRENPSPTTKKCRLTQANLTNKGVNIRTGGMENNGK